MKHKKLLCITLASVLALSMSMFAACGDKDDDDDDTTTGDSWHNEGIWTTAGELVPTSDIVYPESSANRTNNPGSTGGDVRVHDPSVFYDNVGDNATYKYYAFGSHFAVASSYDLIEWEQEASDGGDEVLFDGGVSSAMPTTVSLANNNTDAWAPDVEYYNGKYYMYISFTTAFGSSGSVISRVEADNVLGPYTNETIIIESVSTTESSHPNCIDPELFYDKDGGLWMVYGSYFTGIYIVELYNSGENWGLPKEDGWGTMLWQCGSKVVEGPFVFYSAETDYYYLMTTYGELTSDYNMRIARSSNPDGPYVDITGTDMTANAGGDLYGNKVAGNFKFENASSEWWAMGHNSVVKDANGRYFVIYHKRTAENSNHTLNVNQIYFNEDGWPVVSPTAYVGESKGLISQSAAAGDFEVVVHSTSTTSTVVSSVTYTFSSDGVIYSGTTEAGTWTVSQNYYVTIVLGSVTYKGVLTPGWNCYVNASSQTAVLGITAISDLGNQGGSLWAIRSVS